MGFRTIIKAFYNKLNGREKMELNENIIIELVGSSEADKETLVDYFKEKEIEDLLIEYDLLDINEITKIKISNLLIIFENMPRNK